MANKDIRRLVSPRFRNVLRSRHCLLISIVGFILAFWGFIIISSGKGDNNSFGGLQFGDPFQIFKPSLDYEYVEQNMNQLDQGDSQLIKYTRIKYLNPPSTLPYDLKLSETNYKDDLSGWVNKFFGEKRNGIFIESGANEGEKGSHTLYLEKELGWEGLLIECNPTVVPFLKSKHRKAWVAEVCLGTTTNPAIVKFSNPVDWTYGGGTLKKPWDLPVPTNWTFFDVQTLPFYTILASIGWTEIDFLSLDIEGLELAVFQTFPFHLIKFNVMIIEVLFFIEKQKVELNDLLVQNGYHFVTDLNHGKDKVYIHNSVKHLLSSPSEKSVTSSEK